MTDEPDYSAIGQAIATAIQAVYALKTHTHTGYLSSSSTKGVVKNDGTIDTTTGAVDFIVGTQSASTGSWTGTSNKLYSISAGTRIYYKLPYAGSGNATLNLTLADNTTTGAKAIYFVGSTRVKTQFAANAIIELVYDGTYWRVVNPYTDSNTNYYDRNRFGTTGVKIKTAFTSDYGLLCGDGSGYAKLGSGSSFDLSYPLLYYSSDVDLAVDDLTTNVYSNFNTVAVEYIKANMTLTASSMLYLVGSVSGNVFTVDSSVVTQSPNVSGKVYLPLGFAISSTNFVFFPIYELVTYDGSNLVRFVPEHSHSGYASSSHNHNISNLNNTTTVAVTVTYTDNSTETINLLKYTGS